MFGIIEKLIAIAIGLAVKISDAVRKPQPDEIDPPLTSIESRRLVLLVERARQEQARQEQLKKK